jgi:hypothetical protein
MVGLRDPRLVKENLHNFTHQAIGQVLMATDATEFPDIMTTIKAGRYS